MISARPVVCLRPSEPYLLSQGYLALFGSVLAFGAYLTLLGPIVALLMSTAFEGLRWHAATVLGIVLCLTGNFLVLRRPKKAGA